MFRFLYEIWPKSKDLYPTYLKAIKPPSVWDIHLSDQQSTKGGTRIARLAYMTVETVMETYLTVKTVVEPYLTVEAIMEPWNDGPHDEDGDAAMVKTVKESTDIWRVAQHRVVQCGTGQAKNCPTKEKQENHLETKLNLNK